MQEYEEMEDSADVLLLVKRLKKIVYNFEDQKNVPDALLAADANFHKYCQENDISNDDYYYYQEFHSYYDVINQAGGLLGMHDLCQKVLKSRRLESSQMLDGFWQIIIVSSVYFLQ